MKKGFIKKLMTMAIIACLGCSVVGCSDKNKGNKAETDTRTTLEILNELDIKEYVTLGEYKGLKLEKAIVTVTDKEVEDELKAQLEQYPAKITDRDDVRKGDTANIDYVGRMDGKEFSGGSYKGYNLVIGSGSFIDGFEDALIGVKVGETKVLELKFPNPYPNNPDFAGKPVEFTVTVNSISAPLTEATDAWVAENIEGCSTVMEFKSTLYNMLKETEELAAETQLAYDGWMKVVETSTVHKYPDVLVERGAELYRDELETYAAYYGVDLEGYLKLAGATMEDFEKYAKEYGQSIASQSLINYAICQLEGYDLESDEYKAELKELAKEYNYTEEELFKKYNKDDIEQTVLLTIVCDLIVAEAEVTEVAK